MTLQGKMVVHSTQNYCGSGLYTLPGIVVLRIISYIFVVFRVQDNVQKSRTLVLISAIRRQRFILIKRTAEALPNFP